MSSTSVRPPSLAGSSTTTTQWYVVSASQPPGATVIARPPATTPSSGPGEARRRPSRQARRAEPATSAAPSPTRMPLTGTREISTNPVTTVPTIAPTVPMPDSRPTTVPVSSRLVSSSLVTIGVTADSSAPGTRIVSDATSDSSFRRGLRHGADHRRRDRDGHAGHAQQRRQRPPGVDPVGGASAAPRPDGDRAEGDADDQGAGLQRQPEVRREQPQRGQLDHQHRRGGAEDQDRRRTLSEGGRWRSCRLIGSW